MISLYQFRCRGHFKGARWSAWVPMVMESLQDNPQQWAYGYPETAEALWAALRLLERVAILNRVQFNLYFDEGTNGNQLDQQYELRKTGPND